MNADEWQDHPGSNETGRLVSVAEAAHLLDVSESTIWRWIRAGIIPAYRVGPKRVRLRVEDVRATASPLRSSGLPELTEEEAAELLKANQAGEVSVHRESSLLIKKAPQGGLADFAVSGK